MTLAELRANLKEFAAGNLPAEALEHKLVTLIVHSGLELALSGGPLDDSPAEQLIARLAFHFEDLRDGPEAARREAATVSAALDALAPAAVLAMLPLLLTKGRFADIVRKHRAGIISRTSFVAAVSSARMPAELRIWLLAASDAALAQFESYLRSDELRQLQQLTGLAAA
jgi:hypothetical protein